MYKDLKRTSKLFLILILVLLFNLIFIHGSRIQDNIALTFIEFAKSFRNAEMYDASTFFYKASQKISPRTIWVDWNIAVNIRSKYWGHPLNKEKKRELRKALKLLGSENEKHPNNFSVISEYAYLYRELRQYDEAIEYYEKALAMDPKWEYGLHELAWLYHGPKEDHKKALEYVERKMAIKVDEGYYGDYYSKAVMLHYLGRDSEAVEYYKKYIEKNPTHVAGFVNIAICEVNLKRYEDAEKHVDEGLKYAPNFSYLLHSKIDILKAKHKFAEAKNLSEMLLKRNKYDYSSYLQLAELSRYENKLEEAEKYYQLARECAQKYYDKFCELSYDIGDSDGKCSHRYRFLTNYEKIKNSPLKF